MSASGSAARSSARACRTLASREECTHRLSGDVAVKWKRTRTTPPSSQCVSTCEKLLHSLRWGSAHRGLCTGARAALTRTTKAGRGASRVVPAMPCSAVSLPACARRSQVPTQRARPRGRHRDPRRLRRDSGCRMGLPGSAARRRPQSVSALWESPGRSYAENADPRPARPCRDERAALAQTQEAGEGARRLVMPGTAARSSASQREQASRKPRSLVPIMTTAASGRLRRGSSPLRSCHHRLAVWSPAEGKPLNKDTRTQGD